MTVHLSTAQAQTDAPAATDMALALLLEQAVRGFYPDRGPDQMHPGQWAALRYLGRANAEARTIAGLARYLDITVGPASRAAAALERKGLIAIRVDAADRRVRRLDLTAQGRDLLAADPLLNAARQLARIANDHKQGLRLAVLALLGDGIDDSADPFVLATG